RRGRAGDLPRGEAGIRPRRAAESGQGGADARTLRRVWCHARPWRRAAAPGAAPVLSLQALQERIREAAARRRALRVRGGGTKDFYGNAAEGDVLDTRGYAGVVRSEERRVGKESRSQW